MTPEPPEKHFPATESQVEPWSLLQYGRHCLEKWIAQTSGALNGFCPQSATLCPDTF